MEIMVELLCILGAVARQDMAQKLFKPKSLENLLAYNLFLTCPFILKFCIDHGSDAAMLYEKFQKDPTSKIDVIDEWDFTSLSSRRVGSDHACCMGGQWECTQLGSMF